MSGSGSAGPLGPAPDRPLAFVADLEAPVLDEEDRHHLAHVLRLRPGAPITASDGQGRWRPARLGPDGQGEVEAEGPIEVLAAPVPPLIVAFALVKGDRPAWVTQKLTELGVDHIGLFVAERSVVRWDEARVARQLTRLRRVAKEAAMQSRRCRLPAVGPLTRVDELLGRPGAVLADRGGAPPGLDRPVVLIGPEGGWTDGERMAAPGRVDLGPHVLRAETAAVTAGAVLVALRAGLVTECG